MISDNYAAGIVKASPPSHNIGGLVGADQNGSYHALFWDEDLSEQKQGTGNDNTMIGMSGESSQAMQEQSIYTNAGWDFEHTWAIAPNMNHGYPYLLN